MKTIKTLLIILILLLFGSTHAGYAQIFKKLKDKLKGEETNVPTEMMSNHDMNFEGWSLGNADIKAISVFANDFEKHAQTVGVLKADGNFSYQLPDNLQTWVPISVYGKDCENAGDAVIDNPGVKLAWNRLWVFQNDTPIAEIIPANPFEAAFNLNKGGINNGKLGKYFLLVYADGDAVAKINCKKRMDMTDGKDITYKNMPVEDKFDLHYKKGWNWVEVHNLDNIWVGLTKHYQERTWKVVDTLPNDANWVLVPITN